MISQPRRGVVSSYLRSWESVLKGKQEKDVSNQLQHVYPEMNKKVILSHLPVRHEKRTANSTVQTAEHGPYHPCFYTIACMNAPASFEDDPVFECILAVSCLANRLLFFYCCLILLNLIIHVESHLCVG